jgi:hypothetical protein
MKKIIFILTIVLMYGCSSTNSTLTSLKFKNLPDTDGDGIVDVEDLNPAIVDNLTIDDWIKSRDLLINDWQVRLEEAKIDRRSTQFTIASTIVGVGSGIYGLSGNDNLVPSIGSMLVGAGATLVSQLNLNKRKDKSNKCYYTIERELSTFKAKWTDIDFPDDDIKLIKFKTDKISVINNINSDCLK